MNIRIPLPWYSRAVYSCVDDEWRGGWRFLAFQFCLERARLYGRLQWGFKFAFRAGIGAWFRR